MDTRNKKQNKNDTLDIEFYTTIKEYEHHFNNIIMEIRKLASAWLLVTFGAVAFIVRGDLKENTLLDSFLLISIVCILGAIGLFVLYILDIIVYRGLLSSAFNMGIRIETQKSGIPPLRSMMMVTAREMGMERFQVWYYRTPMLALAIISTTVNLIYLFTENTMTNNIIVILLSLLLVIINWVIVVAEMYSYRYGERRKVDMLVDLGVVPSSKNIKTIRRNGAHLNAKEIKKAKEQLRDIIRNNVKRWSE